MMDIKRKCELEVLSKQPLALVLIQIRFSPVSLLENYAPAIQAALSKLGYPLCDRNENLSVNVTPTGINSQKGYQWTFKSSDQKTNIILDKNQISFQTTKYTVFEEFYEDFYTVFNCAFDLIENFKVANKIQRIGLRYIDQIIPQNTTDTVSSYIKEDFRISNIFEDRQIINTISQSGFFPIENDLKGFLTAKISEGKTGMGVPPELVARAPVLARSIPNGFPSGTIDIDHSFVPQIPEDYNEDKLKLLFYRMHDNTHVVFKRIVSEEGIKKWK